jgi:hypothetical protein
MNVDQVEDDGADFTIESVGLKAANYYNIVDRYFTKYYIDKNTEKEQYVFIHTNGIVMCGLGKNHSIVNSKLKIKEIKDLNKLSKISGKRKHGAHVLMDNEYVAQFILQSSENEGAHVMSDSSDKNTQEIKFNFSPRVKGKLIEINSNLYKNFNLVKEYPEKYGFICFLLLDHNNLQLLKDKLEKMSG